MRVLFCVVEIDIAETEIRRRIIRLQRDGFSVRLDGIFVSAELAIGVAEFVVRFGVIALLEHCLIERDERLLILLQVVIGPTQFVVSLRVIGIDADRLTIGADGILRLVDVA